MRIRRSGAGESGEASAESTDAATNNAEKENPPGEQQV